MKPPKRLTAGLSGKEIIDLANKTQISGFTDVYSLDNIDYARIEARLARGLETCCIVNTAEIAETGEHWLAVHFEAQTSHCTHYDSYGLPPIQKEVYRLCTMTDCCFMWNATPVQDIADKKDVSCGYHALYYLLMTTRFNKPLDYILNTTVVHALSYVDGIIKSV